MGPYIWLQALYSYPLQPSGVLQGISLPLQKCEIIAQGEAQPKRELVDA